MPPRRFFYLGLVQHYTLYTMSSKKTKANGAIPAPENPVLSETSLPETAVKKNGKQANPESTYIPSDFENLIDSRELLKILAEVRMGNFTVRLPNDGIGLPGKIYDTLNDIIILNELLVQELTEARKIIGKQGKLNHRVELPRLARGSWNTAVESINSLINSGHH